MRYIRSSIFFLMSVSCLFLCQSCSTCSRQHTVENITVDIDLANLAIDSLFINMSSGKVLYAAPTPIEVSMLIKNWGIPYPELMNDPAHASGYLTKKKMAINFGVYVTDLTTAGLYEQTQTVLKYKQAIMQLVDGLGLRSAADPKRLQQVEDNINNKNELIQIISDIYASCTEYLSEDDRDFYALAMLSGGWVEGMYIAANMINENDASNGSKMKQLVMDNKLTFDLLWQALGQMDVIPDDAVTLMIDMSYLAYLFGHQTLLTVPPSTAVINNANSVTPELFADLKNHIQLLRQQFVKK